MSAPARELGLDLLAVLALLLRGVVRRDRRGRGSRSRATRRAPHAAHDRQPQTQWRAIARVDRPRDLGDRRRRACGPRQPSSGAAHHHALEDGLSSDRLCHGPLGASSASARPSRAGAGSAPPGRPCPRASACPCRTGGTASRSRREARASSSASGTCSRRNTSRSRGRTRDGSRPSWLSQDSSGLSGEPRCRPRPTTAVLPGSTSTLPASSAAVEARRPSSHASFVRA